MNDTPKLAYNEGRLEDARRLLVEEYSKKKAVRLIQIDGHQVAVGDDILRPDEDGHTLMCWDTYELRNIAGSPHLPVRVELYPGADKEEVLSLLRKITDLVESDFYGMQLSAQQIDDPEEIDDPERPPF